MTTISTPASDYLALLYDADAYEEVLRRAPEQAAGGAMGLMGRQVAGRAFLEAYLTHGTRTQLTAVVTGSESSESLTRCWKNHAASHSGRWSLALVEQHRFTQTFFPDPPAPVLYFPGTLRPLHAWARHAKRPGAFSLCGVTHTLCEWQTIDRLCSLLTAPFEPHDALICTSTSVTRMVRTLTESYGAFLHDRHGGQPHLPIILETIPLGVNPDRYHPPSPETRLAQRRALNVRDDAVAVLFVGRLSFHAKAQPFPMLQGIAEAARQTGQPVHLILCGWTAHPAIMQAFVQGLQAYAPNVPVSVVDGTNPTMRIAVWHAADIFTSLSDNIQETFGLAVLEAMACGLPVVASDWDGYRDLVVPATTGYLVPTYLVKDAAADATLRLMLAEINYDEFLALASQSAIVDVSTAAGFYARLIQDAGLRRQLGGAGRQRVLAHFTWQHIVRAYEALWTRQEKERLGYLGQLSTPAPFLQRPECYPPLEHTFASYPTCLLHQDSRVQTVPGAEARLAGLLAEPLTSYAAATRCTDVRILRTILESAPVPRRLADLDTAFSIAGVNQATGRATVAWLLKYGLLQLSYLEATG
jgi:glycosyltransferase involved in cell wall biosynthesis